MIYITHTDLSRLVLYARLKDMNVAVEKPKVDTDLARQLVDDLDRGEASPNCESDFNRVRRLASVG